MLILCRMAYIMPFLWQHKNKNFKKTKMFSREWLKCILTYFPQLNNSCIPIELPKILFIMIVKRSIETTEGISAVHRHPSNINLDMISALLLWRIGGRLESFSFCSVVCSIRSNLQYDKMTRHVFVKQRCPGGNKTRIWQKFKSPTFWPRSIPRGKWCQWSVRNP